MKDADRDVVIGLIADAIGMKFMGGIPRGPVIDAIKETLTEESAVLVNDWEAYTPALETRDGLGFVVRP